jgi:hypothetical protein
MIDCNVLKNLNLDDLQNLRETTIDEFDNKTIQEAIDNYFLKNLPSQVKKKKIKKKKQFNLDNEDDYEYNDDLADLGLIEEFESKWK